MKRNKDEDVQITPEEKEMLRRLMETPGIEKDWDFFKDMNPDVPPPEFFMRGKPERHFGFRRMGRRLAKVGGFVACVLICAVIIAPFMVPESANADKTPFQILAENIRNGFLEFRPDGEDMEDPNVNIHIDNEDEVKSIGKEFFPELKQPMYIPDGYSFEYLIINKQQDGYSTASYVYKGKNKEFFKIVQQSMYDEAEDVFSYFAEDGSELSKDELYFQHDDLSENNMLTIWPNGTTRFVLAGTLNNQELEKIYNNLK